MKYRKMFVALATVGAAAISMPLAAADRIDRTGFYAGGGIGQSSVEFDNFDDDDTAWKLFAGYRITAAPMLDLAVEGGYRDFGNPEETVGGQKTKYEANGVDLYGVAIAPIGAVDLFGKVGGIWYDQKRTVGGVRDKDNDEIDFAYGFGIGTEFQNIGVRAEWERFELTGTDDVDMYSLNAYWRF